MGYPAGMAGVKTPAGGEVLPEVLPEVLDVVMPVGLMLRAGFAARRSSSWNDAPNPARRMRWAIKAISFVAIVLLLSIIFRIFNVVILVNSRLPVNMMHGISNKPQDRAYQVLPKN